MLIRYLRLATLFYLNNFIECRILISSNFDLFGISHNQIKKKKSKKGGKAKYNSTKGGTLNELNWYFQNRRLFFFEDIFNQIK